MTGLLSRPKEFLSRAEVAKLFNVSPNTITRWADSGKLPYIRTLGGHRRYEKMAVERLAGTLSQEEVHMQTLMFHIPKMYGDHHVAAVHKLLAGLSGIDQVQASAAFQQLAVTFDPTVIAADAIIARLEQAGYATGHADQKQPAFRLGIDQHRKDPAWAALDLRMTQSYVAGS